MSVNSPLHKPAMLLAMSSAPRTPVLGAKIERPMLHSSVPVKTGCACQVTCPLDTNTDQVHSPGFQVCNVASMMGIPV
jgi:hypothetical protein